ncbi:hypothetical protein RHOFW104T7_13155 [Rhodanobacter thiooxydans]|uniref:Uncharacterized protein n=1 Tax=Rhodanobacter thiooxydans TaxID=416169 RepID=A0A154QIM1_9GAMM|nr:hypothetical protein [Rhodanobacter thiooxydans]KZC23544.1 hypothetical protein RHOFW104T7_13155 [Rhodanobacter thiooxydans]
MAQRSFGSGLLFATNTALNSTPIQFGTLQDVQLDVSRTLKELYGQGQFAVAIGAAQQKITCKAKFAQVNGQLYNDLFFGGSSAVGQTLLVYQEAGTIPAVTTYTVTVTGSATFVEDEGVLYSATGLPFKKVASAPTVGQYSVAAGVYTFAAADASAAVLISYTKTSAATGVTINANNPLQGVQPVFSMILVRQYNGQQEAFKLWSCIASKLSLPTKMADWGITEIDFSCFADSAGRTITPYVSE